jgi:hypothetical protein
MSDDGSVEFKLNYPVEFDGKVYEVLTLRRPKAKHIKKLGKNADLEEILLVAGRVAGVPLKVMDELDASDAMRIAEVVGGFLEVGQRTMPSY